jgi:hypothetical protein
VGKLTHWSHPGGGEPSSGISTTTAREPPARAGPCCDSVDASARTSVAASSTRGAAVTASGRVSATAGAS